jgi:hypothetical protein
MSYNPGPRTVGIQLSSELAQYIERAIQLGAFSGPLGSMDLNPALKPLIEGVNRVLAGGAVTVQVTQPGDPTIYNELTNDLANGIKEANAINKAAGYYVTVGA